ncbi:MAG TPA: glutamate 5-kinase [Desulfitobacteriaceae bacterium]|nr:glutamate 5-kinase [Desulfitobacteriaceae bacterium]
MNGEIRRIVLKIGSTSLNQPAGGLDEAAIAKIVGIIADLHAQGIECVLVSSGAVAAGMGQLQLQSRPRGISAKQALAAVGQGLLIGKYAQCFSRHNLISAQILLTRSDLADPLRYRNVRNTIETLLRLKAIPVINENDSVAVEELVEELCFGDNDRLSALVAGLVHADLLIILTDVDGLYTANPKADPSARLIKEVKDIAKVKAVAGGAGSIMGTGGMATKLQAARIATRFGIGMMLLNSARMEEMLQIPQGLRPYGTYFVPKKRRLAGRKGWIAYAGLSEGTIIIDDGAVRALVNEGKSLLSKGVIEVKGSWERKELVCITNARGQEIARGLAELNSGELQEVLGKHSKEMLELIPGLEGEEVVHRDNMTLICDPDLTVAGDAK